jgi:hypothetical protein
VWSCSLLVPDVAWAVNSSTTQRSHELHRAVLRTVLCNVLYVNYNTPSIRVLWRSQSTFFPELFGDQAQARHSLIDVRLQAPFHVPGFHIRRPALQNINTVTAAFSPLDHCGIYNLQGAIQSHWCNGVAQSLNKRAIDQEQLPRRHQWPRPLVNLSHSGPLGSFYGAGAAYECLPKHGCKGEHSEGRDHWG